MTVGLVDAKKEKKIQKKQQQKNNRKGKRSLYESNLLFEQPAQHDGHRAAQLKKLREHAQRLRVEGIVKRMQEYCDLANVTENVKGDGSDSFSMLLTIRRETYEDTTFQVHGKHHGAMTTTPLHLNVCVADEEQQQLDTPCSAHPTPQGDEFSIHRFPEFFGGLQTPSVVVKEEEQHDDVPPTFSPPSSPRF